MDRPAGIQRRRVRFLSPEARALLLDLRPRMHPREYRELVQKTAYGDQIGGGDVDRPAGIELWRCRGCGFEVWAIRASPETAAKIWRAGKLPRTLFLEPHETDKGDIAVVDGVGELVERGQGRFLTHRCPGRTVLCRNCGQPIRVMHLPPTISGERMVVVDATADAAGPIVVVDGYAVHDPDHQLDGARYRWHTRHEPSTRHAGML